MGKKWKIDGGSIRSGRDGGGAISQGAGKGTESDPHVHSTVRFDSDGNVKEVHTTVIADGKKWEDREKHE